MTVKNNPEITKSLQKFERLSLGGDVALLGQAMRNIFRAVPIDAVKRLGAMVGELSNNDPAEIAKIAQSLNARVDQVASVNVVVPESLNSGIKALSDFSQRISDYAVEASEDSQASLLAAWDSFEHAVDSNWVEA